MPSHRGHTASSTVHGLERVSAGITFSILLPLLLLVGGCSTASQNPGVGDNYSFSQEKDEGLVVISTSYTNDNCTGLLPPVVTTYFYSTSGSNFSRQIAINNPLIINDFENPPGYFFVLNVPAGSYRFASLEMLAGSTKYSGQLPNFSPFSVAAGQVVYIGQLTINIPDCSKFRTTFEDHTKRDRAMFEKRVPNLSSAPFVTEIPTIENSGVSIINK